MTRLNEDGSIYKLPSDLARAFLKGLQFDTAIISYGLVLPFFVYLICSFIRSENIKLACSKFVFGFCGLTTGVIILILFIDQYYYSYFQSHINVLIFGLIDDDTSAVMISVWSDYPILRILMIWSGLLTVYYIYVSRIHKKEYFLINAPVWACVVGCFFIAGVFFLGIRQSVGTFPIQSHDGMVSKNNYINFLTINGVWALNSSFEERAKSVNFEKASLNSIKEMGYDTPAQAARDYFSNDSVTHTFSDSSALESLYQTTQQNLIIEENKPNVVFIFMESMSNYNMDFDSKDMNLLGNLRNHLKSDILFRNFVSSGNATIQSLEYLLINTPVSVTQSKFRFTAFPSAVALPFKKAGYENTFITGGETSWRNLNEFVPHQGFASVKGKQDILAADKKAEANHWGVYDEYLFDYAFKKLLDDQDKPQFLFLQTTTNHTPFDLPNNYKPNKIILSKTVKNRLLVSEEMAVKNLNCFQYSNNCLGDFLYKIKHSYLGKNTIVVMTGDHNNLSLFDFNEAHQLQQRGVPLYMYIPKTYKPKYPINTALFGSHKDIFPSIYNLALSNARYYSIGNDLVSSPNKRSYKGYFGINIGSSTAFDSKVAVNYSTSPASYVMRADRSLVAADKSDLANDLLKHSRANYVLSMFFILKSLKERQ